LFRRQYRPGRDPASNGSISRLFGSQYRHARIDRLLTGSALLAAAAELKPEADEVAPKGRRNDNSANPAAAWTFL
jgi:hypothetical protein